MINDIFSKKNILIIFLTIVFVLNFILSPLLFSGIANASSIDKKDIYRGLGIGVLLVILSKMNENQSNESQIRDDFNYDEDVDDENFDILASAIFAEARGEPYEGQVAVGAVIMNRVKNKNFPNTIKEVVYQSGQFSSVTDGQIDLEPNETAYKAAEEALKGNDPSADALYFYNPKTAKTLWWLTTRDTVAEIGSHVFAR